MTSAGTDRDQGLLALIRSVGARLFYASTVTFHNEQEKVDEETDFLVGKLGKNDSIICSYLTEPILQELGKLKTVRGFTLKDGLRRGIREKDKIGILAGDEESYVLFQSVFDRLVRDIHGVSADHLQTTSLCVDAPNNFLLDKPQVLSCRLRVLRSLKGVPFSWFCTRDQRLFVEAIVTGVLDKLKDNFQGKYIPLSRLQDQELEHILEVHHLFLKQRCFTNRVWKEGRGIWYDAQNRLLVVVNEDEHIKVICQKFGGDLWAVLSTLKGLLIEIENFLGKDGYEFMRTHHYGYLVSRPLELGTSLRVSVNVKLPLTAKDARLPFVLKSFGLRRGKSGLRFSDPQGCRRKIFEVSNDKRMGENEVELIQQFITGVTRLIEMEELLTKNLHMDTFITDIVKNTHNTRDY